MMNQHHRLAKQHQAVTSKLALTMDTSLVRSAPGCHRRTIRYL